MATPAGPDTIGRRLRGGVAIFVEHEAPELAASDDVLLALLVGGEVDRRRLDRGVAEQGADVGDGRAAAQQLGRACVPQRVRVAQLMGIFAAAARRFMTAATTGWPQRRPTRV